MAKQRTEALYRECTASQACQTWIGFFLNFAVVLWCAVWLTLIADDEAPVWPWLAALLPPGLFLAIYSQGYAVSW